MAAPDILVLGGGIIGLGCAWELQRRGHRVAVLDADHPGAASPASAGMLGPLAEAEDTGPFFAACRQSLELWSTWSDDLTAASGLALDHDRSGTLLVDDNLPGHLQRLIDLAEATGEPHQLLSTAELRQLVPDLAPGVGEALLLPREHRIDNRRVCEALRLTLARGGSQVLSGHLARNIRQTGDAVEVSGDGWTHRAARLLITCGAWSGQLAGIPRLPVRPIRGQMLRLGEITWPWLGSLRGPCFYAVRRTGDRLIVGATVEEAGDHPVTTPEGLHQLSDFCRRLLPGLVGRPVEQIWAGLRPATPDQRPLLGPLPHPASSSQPGGAVWVATGHYRNGILLAPWTAQTIAHALTNPDAPDLWQGFLPGRFLPPSAQDPASKAEFEDCLSTV